MKIVQVNTFPYKATGAVMMGIHRLLTERGEDSYVVWARGRDARDDHEIVIKDELGVRLHGVYTRLTDRTGFASARATRRLLKRLDEIGPDVVHLHNIHGYYLHIGMLFDYLKARRIPLVWTLHDCWAMTGHCAFFDMAGCDRWKTGCHDCPQKSTYPASAFLDASRFNWSRKKELFTGLSGVIVTPCEWLAGYVRQSYLRDYPVKVIYNGIDLNVFTPSDDAQKRVVRQKYGLDERPLVLGVASEWTERKGLRDIVSLSEKLSDGVQFAAVGLTAEQIRALPPAVKGIGRTANAGELAALYSAADVFINPTYEDNFPSTNVEALACGTPVLTYDTGGSPESIRIGQTLADRPIGAVVNKLTSSRADLDQVTQALNDLLASSRRPDGSPDPALETACRRAAGAFEAGRRLNEYVPLYEGLLQGTL